MSLPVYQFEREPRPDSGLPAINSALIEDWLIKFIQFEVQRRRQMSQVVLGLSGGADSAVVAYLCAKALGPKNVHAIRLPYKVSSSESLSHAELVIDALGLESRTIDITDMVDGYATKNESMTPHRIGNLCARCRTAILFDLSFELQGLPMGTGNKSERLLGYYTWHADDAPPINPLGDLYKTHVWQLAEHLGVPDVIVKKPASADLIKGQTDEGDFGITYKKADPILDCLIRGYTVDQLIEARFPVDDVNRVNQRLGKTHWKRKLPTIAMLSSTAIGEYYLRPVDY